MIHNIEEFRPELNSKLLGNLCNVGGLRDGRVNVAIVGAKCGVSPNRIAQKPDRGKTEAGWVERARHRLSGEIFHHGCISRRAAPRPPNEVRAIARSSDRRLIEAGSDRLRETGVVSENAAHLPSRNELVLV